MKPVLIVLLLFLAFTATPTSDGLSVFGFTIPGLCLFKTVFHIDCPVCGMTRSVTSAAHMKFAESFNFHPLGMPFLGGVVLYGLYLLITKSPFIPLSQRGRLLYPPLLQRGDRGDFERVSQSVGVAHPTNDSKELAIYRNLSKLFSAALLIVWAYKIMKEVYLWH